MGFLLQFLATKAIAPILGSIVLLSMGEHPVSLSKPEVFVSGDTLFISTRVNNGFTKELMEIVKSGTPVTLRLKVEAVENIYFIHTVQYDIEKRIYTIEREGEKGEAKTEDEKKMQEFVSNFSHVFILVENIPSSQKITIRASLDPVKLDFLEDEEFDLMTLWDYRSPQQTIDIKSKNP